MSYLFKVLLVAVLEINLRLSAIIIISFREFTVGLLEVLRFE
ncbi:hypothetical protein THF1C08_30285 [Vibrio jasicida]|uniref:Uncharacterized protein n=1 Tax=Vibrio jasicida TaxID=766224 RepID=A0AAU9QT35_9VIBR|nr:hypothetical protein THF1C08_30285 [Vibrio jasicida]CAH1599456.1 hypothetical protein THF1A12_40149 [Vibrio jasicida]